MPVSYGDIRRDARQRLRGRRPSAYLVAAAYLALSTVISLLIYRISGYSVYADALVKMYTDVLQNGAEPYLVQYPAVNPIGIVLAAALAVMSLILQYGFDSCCLQVARCEKAGVRDLFNGFNQFGRVAALLLLRALIIGALSMLCLIPGIIAYYRYRPAVYVMLDHPELSPVQCLTEAARQTRGHKIEYFVLDLTFIGWQILSNIVAYVVYLPLLDIWVAPYMGAATAILYDRLNGCYDPAAQYCAENPAE